MNSFSHPLSQPYFPLYTHPPHYCHSLLCHRSLHTYPVLPLPLAYPLAFSPYLLTPLKNPSVLQIPSPTSHTPPYASPSTPMMLPNPQPAHPTPTSTSYPPLSTLIPSTPQTLPHEPLTCSSSLLPPYHFLPYPEPSSTNIPKPHTPPYNSTAIPTATKPFITCSAYKQHSHKHFNSSLFYPYTPLPP